MRQQSGTRESSSERLVKNIRRVDRAGAAADPRRAFDICPARGIVPDPADFRVPAIIVRVH